MNPGDKRLHDARKILPTGIALGAALLLVAALLLSMHAVQAPARAQLQAIAGTLNLARQACRRGGCWVELRVRTDQATVDLIQHDYPAVESANHLLAPGDAITAWVAPDASEKTFNSEEPPLYFWELRRGADLLVRYEDTSAAFLSNAHDWRTVGYAVAAAGCIALLAGFLKGGLRGINN